MKGKAAFDILIIGGGAAGLFAAAFLKTYAPDIVFAVAEKTSPGTKLLMTGDHARPEYDEVNPMKEGAVRQGVPSEDVFMDHAGLSTYESIYRARDVFGAKRVIVVTQAYHLPRSLYIARALGLEAVGVACDTARYRGQFFRDVREVLARDKDFVKCIFQPEPTYLGEAISLQGSGDVTNDR